MYLYEPCLDTVLLPNGMTVPKVYCKAFPDKGKDFFNTLSFEEMEDKLYRIREKWEEYQYDFNQDGLPVKVKEKDEYEGEIWGLTIKNDWNLIGNVFIFMNSMAMLLDTPSDEAPIIDGEGEEQGTLSYSISLKLTGMDGMAKN
mmetsp:Transcript_1291/g.1378  ORF Transcript_1291/g.1378 Transcript_1291/m.1378 type:complete len:144 (+) Transcript_1291:1659-2090(+)